MVIIIAEVWIGIWGLKLHFSDKIWCANYKSENPYFLNYPPTDTIPPFVSSLISGRSVSAVVDGYCSKPKSINSDAPQGSVLSPTLFLLFINDLSTTEWPIHSYDNDSTLHYSITFKSHPLQTIR